MENTGQAARATVQTPDGRVRYDGDARIDGVPGGAAPVPLLFSDTAGSTCGVLPPTGNPVDQLDGVAATLTDNGMPCVILAAADLGVTGYETCAELEANTTLRGRVEQLRLAAGPLMRLGEVGAKLVPRMVLVAPPRAGGALCTRSFIPHRSYDSIGVVAAVTVATAAILDGSPARRVSSLARAQRVTVVVERPRARPNG